MENYIEKHKEKIIKTPGGTLCQVFGQREGANCSVAIVKMDSNSNGVKHYHDNITEIYLFAKGKGTININENENSINEGECYIIPAGNTHYISAETIMEFACICTPPWTEEHEFIVEKASSNNNITPTIATGIIQKLSAKLNHNVTLYEINKFFQPTDNMKNYRRVYYIIEGEGNININNNTYKLNAGDCYEIIETSNEFIETNKKIRFVLVCDIIKNN